jgi:hypothetical protein
MIILNEIRYNHATSAFASVVNWRRFEKFSFTIHVLSYRISREIKTTQVKEVHIYIKRQLEIAKLKSTCLSYNVVVSLPLE